MDRREFLRQASLWSTGMVLLPPVFNISREVFAASAGRPEVLVAKNVEYAGMVREMVQALGGMSSFVKTGDKVVIKPNIGWDRNVDQGANTHPLVVVELARLCLDAGASKVSVFDRTCNEERRCYHNSGIASALEKIRDKRLRMDYVDDRKFVSVNIDNGQVLTEWSFYRDALEADCYINVPVAKHHGLSKVSLGLKNIMGIVGGRRGRLHYQLGPKLADLNMVIRPDLTLVDATRVIMRNGPQGGDLKDVKILDTLIGSVDPVAADAFATTLFGLRPDQIEATVEAHKRGLGQIDLNQCHIRYLNA